jgi:hypothetical protein
VYQAPLQAVAKKEEFVSKQFVNDDEEDDLRGWTN